MATVKIFKKEAQDKDLKPISFSKNDYVAIKGTKLSTFEGELKVCHKHLAEKLVKDKKATIEKDIELEENTNAYRNVADAPKPKK